MNKKIGYCFLAACQLLVGTGCTQTEVEEGRGVEDEGMEVQFRLSVLPENAPRTRSLHFTTRGCTEVDGLPATVGAGTPVTRAGGLTETEEATLNHLCVVQFNNRGAQVGSPIFLPSLAEAAADGTTTLKVVIKKSSGTNTLYFLANAGDQTEAIYGKNEASFKKMMQAIAFTETGMPQNSWCMMVGVWKGLATDEPKSVELTRAVAKINFSYSISSTNDFSFTPTRLRLCNVPQQIHYVSSGAQPTAVDYTSYTAPDFGTAASWCWYLPENQAGIAEGEGIATSDKEKTGVGVSNATYIELTGDAVQGTDLYPGVVFRLYPGSTDTDGYNDYNVNRNTSYTINITLTGIDFADKRVTVGEIPAMAKPDTLGARIGATVPFRITSQPGKTGAFVLPDWLSAEIGGSTFGAGAKVSYTESVDATFSSLSINPSDDPRDFTFRVDSTDVTVTQAGLVFSPALQTLVLPTKGTAKKLKLNVSDGVEWTLAYASGFADITTETVGGAGTQDVTFKGPANTGNFRSAYFTLTVVGCDPIRTYDIEVRQDPVIPAGSEYKGIQVAPKTATPGAMTWADALYYCANLSVNYHGRGSWRLPTWGELQTMADGYKYKMYTGDYVLVGGSHWSSDEYLNTHAYMVNINGGVASQYPKTSRQWVRCVRQIP